MGCCFREHCLASIGSGERCAGFLASDRNMQSAERSQHTVDGIASLPSSKAPTPSTDQASFQMSGRSMPTRCNLWLSRYAFLFICAPLAVAEAISVFPPTFPKQRPRVSARSARPKSATSSSVPIMVGECCHQATVCAQIVARPTYFP